MPEKFEYPVSGTVTDTWQPSVGADPGQSTIVRDDGVVQEQSSGLGEYRYNEGVRQVGHKLGFVRAALTDRLSFEAFKDLVGGQLFRYTDFLSIVHKVSFAAYRGEYRAEPNAADLWNFTCELREESPPPGLQRVPSTLYADLMFYLRATRGVTAYGRDAVGATFTRASTATYVDPYDGVIKSAAANVPRFESAGLLMEGARTNLCLRSEDFSNASWTKTNVTVSANDTATLDPAGGNTADSLTASAANGTVLQTFTISSASKVFSLFLKRKTGTGNIDVTLDNGSTWTTKTISASAWTRVIQVQTLANPTIGIRIVTNADAVWAWGGQLEDGVTFASSYIPTTSASVARSADALTYPGSNNLTAATGSAIVVYTPAAIDNAVAQCLLALDDGTANERIALITSTSAALRPRATVDDGGVNQADITVGAGTDDFAALTKKSIGVTWAVNDIHLYTTGIDRGSDSGATMPAPTTIRIGSAIAADPIFGWLRDIAIFGRALTGAEMLSVHNALIL